MRPRIVFFAAYSLLTFLPCSHAALQVDVRKVLTPGDLQRFYGQVKAVDRSARTVTIEIPMRFVFHLRAETKITQRGGGAASFDNVKVGEGIDVVAHHGADNSWTALTIKLEPGASFGGEISARTVHGQTITGLAVGLYLAYQPPAELINRNIDFGRRTGLFLLTVRSDGTVSNVRPLKSLGEAELNERASQWLMKWKFRPNSVTEVRVPMNYNSFRRY